MAEVEERVFVMGEIKAEEGVAMVETEEEKETAQET